MTERFLSGTTDYFILLRKFLISQNQNWSRRPSMSCITTITSLDTEARNKYKKFSERKIVGVGPTQ